MDRAGAWLRAAFEHGQNRNHEGAATIRVERASRPFDCGVIVGG
jgi:hypothetical protein